MVDERQDTGRRKRDRWSIWDKRIRDLGIYLVAIAGVINEEFFVKTPSEVKLIFLAAMLGFPLVLRADELRRTARYEEEKTHERREEVK